MKYTLFILILIISGHSHAQDGIAISNQKLDQKQYLEAKSAIDKVFEAENLAENARAWYTKGRVYHEILKSDDARVKSLKENRTAWVSQVVEAYEKTLALTSLGDNLNTLAANQIEILWADGINSGYEQFQQAQFIEATQHFELAQLVKPADTTAYLYAGLSAQNAGAYERAIKNYLALRQINRLSKTAYNGLIISKEQLGASREEQLQYVEEALFEYPNHLPYIIREIRLLIALQRFEEAESVLETALLRNPNQPILLLRQADLFDRIFKSAYENGEPESSERYFIRASQKYEQYLQQNSDDFTANYNYSVMINEKANRVYVTINLMGKEEYQLRGKEVEEIGHDWTRRALPYMEKARQLNPDNENVKKALAVYYKRLEMNDKLAQISGQN